MWEVGSRVVPPGIVRKAKSNFFQEENTEVRLDSGKNSSNKYLKSVPLRFQKLSPSCIFLLGSVNYHYSDLNFNNIPSVEETTNTT
jgi:hypothetical protein